MADFTLIRGLSSLGVLNIFTSLSLNRYGKTSSPIWGGAVKRDFVSWKSSVTLNSPRITEGNTSFAWVSDRAYIRMISPTFTQVWRVLLRLGTPRCCASLQPPSSPGSLRRTDYHNYRISLLPLSLHTPCQSCIS